MFLLTLCMTCDFFCIHQWWEDLLPSMDASQLEIIEHSHAGLASDETSNNVQLECMLCITFTCTAIERHTLINACGSNQSHMNAVDVEIRSLMIISTKLHATISHPKG